MRVVHLFNHTQGSRYHVLVNQGLAFESRVTHLNINQDALRLGHFFLEATPTGELVKACEQADLIFRPSRAHFDVGQTWDKVLDRYGLWPRVVYYDFADWPALDSDVLQHCKLYVKRTPLRDYQSGQVMRDQRVHYAAYGVLDEYLPNWRRRTEADRKTDILSLFHRALLRTKNPAEDSRRAMLRYLMDWRDEPGHGLVIETGSQTTRSGRREIFEPPQGNAFIEYLDKLRCAKIVVSPVPDHAGGDNRLWEAFAQGALVVSNLVSLEPQHGFIPGVHYIEVNPLDSADLAACRKTMEALLADDEQRQSIARAGQAHAIGNHRAAHRIGGMIDAAI